MRVYEIIRKKRDGEKLSEEEIKFIIHGYTDESIPDYQMSAFIMAVFFNGLDGEELKFWTHEMIHSGEILDLSSLRLKKIDKHSTGGVGDKISIPLTPLVASCGVCVPMMSGRGLGHTGGTLDKLESIKGFKTDLAKNKIIENLKKIGAVMIGQTEKIAPADKKIYALRDATATVESIPLISSSIMSKKLAEGIDGLVLDIKVGKGAFMKTLEKGEELANTMIGIGRENGIKVSAFITDMDEPLGYSVGNSLEIKESIDVLKGKGPSDVNELVISFGAEMLILADVAKNFDEGKNTIISKIKNGEGLQKFKELISAQGGDEEIVDNPALLPSSKNIYEYKAEKQGYIAELDAYKIGVSSLLLGAGRQKKEDKIDYASGIVLRKKTGDYVKKGELILELHHNFKIPQEVFSYLKEGIKISEYPVKKKEIIKKILR